MSESTAQLPCVLIPVSQGWLMLPNVAIAEIVDLQELDDADTLRDGIAGYGQWRGLRLPMVSWELANGRELQQPEEDHKGRGRVLILNSIGPHHERMPFLALLTQGIPRQAKVAPEQLQSRQSEKGPADAMTVDFDGEVAVIPDLEYLEELARNALTE
ncbi:MAG: chemotaxis protein CheW [Oleiphilaceae bacterium]|nr:chemotaxis protein CheW [Oleiphilaceae bacterium]